MSIDMGRPSTAGHGPSKEEPPDTGAPKPAAGDRHRLTALQGLSALSLDAMASVAYGPESIVLVLAAAGAYGMGFTLPVTVTHPAPEDRKAAEALRRDRELWNPGVETVEIAAPTRSLGRPVSAHVGELARSHPGAQVTVLIPETEPARLWERLLQNQRGAVVAHAVRRDTDAVICRLRFRVTP